mgnify:FL=1
MNPLIAVHESELVELCRRYHVQRLELFGSAATGRFRPDTSDLDFLVEFRSLTPGEHADAYFGLLFALEDMFQRRIDLVEEGAIENPYFQRIADQSRTPVYAA